MPDGIEEKDIARLQKPEHERVRDDEAITSAKIETSGVTMLAIVLIGIMAIGKLVFGILINSVALLSEGIHTLLDLFAAFVSYFTVRAASEPADIEHRYGHGKIENVAGIAQAAFIFIPTLFIIYRAILGLVNLETVLAGDGADIGTIVMFLTILVNIFLALRLLAVAKKHKSEAIRAAAYHQLNDLWTSIGVCAALLLIWIFPDLKILDPLVALVVTAISIWMAWSLFSVSLQSLLDRAAGRETDEKILGVIENNKPLVRGYHNLRTRVAGNITYIDLHVELCGELNFRQAHDIIEKIEAEIVNAVGGTDVIIHADPCIEDCNSCELELRGKAD